MSGDQNEAPVENMENVDAVESVETGGSNESPVESTEVKSPKPKKPSTKKTVKKAPKKEEPKTEAPVIAKKAAKKVAPKPEAKKSTPAPKDKAAKKRAVVKDGVKSLSAAQVKILKVLSKYGHLTGQEIAKRANVNSTMIGNQAGYRNPEINERPVHQWNLLNRGYVKLEIPEEGSTQLRYAITAAGVKALSKE